ncbi:nitroreductase family protein, partial [Kibdelosporangium lantanae]
VGLRPGSPKRAAPSAGACYPYEILLAPVDEPVVGVVDLVQRRIVIDGADRHRWTGDTDTYTYFLVGRPWLSMRRYGRRGYLYHLLDAGHALFNLSLTTVGDAVRQLDSMAYATGYALDRAGALLGVGMIRADGPSTAQPGWVTQERTTLEVPVTDLESMITELVPPPPGPVYVPQLTGVLADALGRRRSAGAFGRDPGQQGLAEAVAEVQRLCERLVSAFEVPTPRIKVFSRQPDVGIELPDTVWLARALLGQQNLVNASTFLVIHGEIPDKSQVALSAEAQRALIGAGIAGEIGYLVAARAGIAVTGVGGFDPDQWARLCGTTDDVLFLLAFGIETAGEKRDVTSTGGNHSR